MNVARFPRLNTRASLRARENHRRDDPLAIQPGGQEEKDLKLLRGAELAAATLILVIGGPFGFFFGQAVVLAVFRAAGLG